MKFEEEKKNSPILPKRHSLNTPLIVSLTSYKPRFHSLHLTLKSLLEQTVTPDVIVLWIAESEFCELPELVNVLSDRVNIIPTVDLRSYKKIVPALERYADCHIVICDDDAYYPRRWLGELVQGILNSPRSTIAKAVHRFHYLPDGIIAPIIDWSFDVQDDRARIPSRDSIPVGVGGVLYPPGSLYTDVSDATLFSSLCPTSDDLWLYVMARLNGYYPIKVGSKFLPVYWPGTQQVGLFQENLFGNDDMAIQRLVDHYGVEVFSS
ncbi:MAG: glycosyltransferase family 2 protein [Gammaproteobacteria bacterium]|nr:glycosyltransferase family 2 protein [Gammaproteobacteria bacterium]